MLQERELKAIEEAVHSSSVSNFEIILYASLRKLREMIEDE